MPRQPMMAGRRDFAGILALLALMLAPMAQAQDATADPGFVVSRTVNPRIAYRGVPVEDNPIHVRATTFPAQAFGTAMDATMAFLVEDGELGQALGSAGVVTDATESITDPLARQAQAGLFRSGHTQGTPLGAGATTGGAGGAIRNATAGISSTITGALQPALQGGTP